MKIRWFSQGIRTILFWVMLAGVLAACAGEAPVQATPAATIAEEKAPTPTVRKELHATDPATVSLASGGPELVEFFAFW